MIDVVIAGNDSKMLEARVRVKACFRSGPEPGGSVANCSLAKRIFRRSSEEIATDQRNAQLRSYGALRGGSEFRRGVAA